VATFFSHRRCPPPPSDPPPRCAPPQTPTLFHSSRAMRASSENLFRPFDCAEVKEYFSSLNTPPLLSAPSFTCLPSRAGWSMWETPTTSSLPDPQGPFFDLRTFPCLLSSASCYPISPLGLFSPFVAGSPGRVGSFGGISECWFPLHRVPSATAPGHPRLSGNWTFKKGYPSEIALERPDFNTLLPLHCVPHRTSLFAILPNPLVLTSPGICLPYTPLSKLDPRSIWALGPIVPFSSFTFSPRRPSSSFPFSTRSRTNLPRFSS